MSVKREVSEVARQFAIEGKFLEAAPYGGGHINETYLATYERGGANVRAVLQRINEKVFADTAALMENIERVTQHLAAKAANEPDSERRTLRLIADRDGRTLHVGAEGGQWRAWEYVDGARSYDAIRSMKQAFEGARAFGRFLTLLADLPAPRLKDTIPGFHYGPGRFAALARAVTVDAAGRAGRAGPEIAFALKRSAIASDLAAAGLPERVTHNDTKINNVLLDDATGEGICVIDLDTVMPGYAAYDFGDLVRSATCTAAEDEPDLSKVTMRFDFFEALARGYLSAARELLTRVEKESLVEGGKLITFLMGIRFLTDYLNGDTYYKVHRADHNLDRCRVQFRLLESIEAHESAMVKFIRSIG